MDLNLTPTSIFVGLIGAAVGFAALTFIVLRRERAVWIIGPMLFASCLGVGVEWDGRIIRGPFFPLQSSRSEIFLVLGIALGLHVIVHSRALAGRTPAFPAVVLTLIGLYAAMLRFVHEGGASGVESIVYWAATLLPLLLIVPILVQDFNDPFRILRTITWVNLAWVALVAVQVVVRPSSLVMGRENRFIGLLGNPQHAGSLMAVFTAVGIYLILNDHRKFIRLLSLALCGANVILLAWTGSRTGLGMAVLAISGVLYSRVGKAILWLPAIAILTVIALEVAKSLGLTIGFERLASTQNTRAESWTNLLRNGLSSPVIGRGVQELGDSENGYLYGFAAYGFGMVMLIGLLIAATIATSLKLWSRRKYLPLEYRSLCDFTIGYFALYFGGSMFEGYMMARVAANLTFFMLFAGIAGMLIQMTDQALAAQAWEEEEGLEYESAAEDEGGGYAQPAT